MNRKISVIIISAACAFLIGCATQPHAPAPEAAQRIAIPEPRTGEDAYRLLRDYSTLGLHRTGTEGGERLIQWLDQHLGGMRLKPEIERFEFNQFIPQQVALTLEDGSALKAFPYWYSGRTAAAGIHAELIHVGRGTQADFDANEVSGKLVVADIDLYLRTIFTNLADVMRRAHAAGAVGVIATTQGPPDNLIVAANAESEAGLCGLPVLFIGAQDGMRLRRHTGQRAAFKLDADYRQGTSANVVATIPGKSNDTLIVGTPVNGWFATASERGAGVGTLLSLARHYSERARSGHIPDKTLVFVFSGGHEVGFLGLQRYIDAHPDVLAKTFAYVHLGASIAGTYYFQKADGTTDSAPIADPARMLFVSENPLLQRLVSSRQLSSGLLPAQFILPSVMNPGEQRRMYARGVPIVSMSGTTLYFHTEADSPGTTSAALLDPVVQFYGAILDDLLSANPAEVLNNNKLAASLVRPTPAPVCVVPAP